MNVLQAHDRSNTGLTYYLHVNSAGYYSEIDYNTGTNRPNGWRDYQIIIITNGEMEVERDGKITKYKKGSLILFKPDEAQKYSCKKDTNSAYIWIHFTGYAVKDILEEFCLYKNNCYFFNTNNEDIYNIKKIITELSFKKPLYRIRATEYFLDFLYSIKTRIDLSTYRLSDYDKISPAIDKIISHPNGNYTAQDLANLTNLSLSRFLHLFKQLLNKTPMALKNELLLERAKNMLIDTDLSVTEISIQLGEIDPLYFSKKFKKAFGLSPTTFREVNKITP